MPASADPRVTRGFGSAGFAAMTSKLGTAAARLRRILPLLDRHYPDARCTLVFSTPLELLVATILSAQCTDERVNKVTPALFAKYRSAAAYAAADPAVLGQEIRSTDFFRNKAANIIKLTPSPTNNRVLTAVLR